MTEEEVEAIEEFEKLIKLRKNKCGEITHDTCIVSTAQLETVLSMLEEKDKEIQFLKDINKTEQDRHKQTEKSLKGQIEKKDKIIDEIIRAWKQDDVRSLEEIKQYFERKVENGN